jgi:ABC-type uncharacterized transport system substrate-binding protein
MRIPSKIYLWIFSVLALCDPSAAAQQAQKLPKIGFLASNGDFPSRLESFRQGLREIGYIEGQNLVLHLRTGRETQLKDLAAELVQLKVDVIVAPRGDAVSAAKAVTNSTPIVGTFLGDPVRLGYLTSLERPGGNITGVNGLTLELGGKWLELVKEIKPSAKRVGVFYNAIAEEKFPLWKSLDAAARNLGIEIRWFHAGDGYLNVNLRKSRWRQVDGFIVLPGFSHSRNLRDLADFGLRNKIPGILWSTELEWEQYGGVVAYGANPKEQARRIAYPVDKILKGAKPADLPVERPTQFELVINLRTAKEIGVTIHPEVLMWADRVIQ